LVDRLPVHGDVVSAVEGGAGGRYGLASAAAVVERHVDGVECVSHERHRGWWQRQADAWEARRVAEPSQGAPIRAGHRVRRRVGLAVAVPHGDSGERSGVLRAGAQHLVDSDECRRVARGEGCEDSARRVRAELHSPRLLDLVAEYDSDAQREHLGGGDVQAG